MRTQGVIASSPVAPAKKTEILQGGASSPTLISGLMTNSSTATPESSQGGPFCVSLSQGRPPDSPPGTHPIQFRSSVSSATTQDRWLHVGVCSPGNPYRLQAPRLWAKACAL